MFVDHLNGHHETFKGQFIKWTIYGEMPIGLKSHQDSLFWSIGSLLSEGYYGRPCIRELTLGKNDAENGVVDLDALEDTLIAIAISKADTDLVARVDRASAGVRHLCLLFITI